MQYYRRIKNCIKPDTQDNDTEYQDQDLDMHDLKTSSRTPSTLKNKVQTKRYSTSRNNSSQHNHKYNNDLIMRSNPNNEQLCDYSPAQTLFHTFNTRRVKSQQSRRLLQHQKTANKDEKGQLLNQDSGVEMNKSCIHTTPTQSYAGGNDVVHDDVDRLGQINQKVNGQKKWSGSSPTNSMIGPGVVSQQSMNMNHTQGSNVQYVSLGGSSSTSQARSKPLNNRTSSQQSQYQSQQQISLLQTAQSGLQLQTDPDRMMQEIKSMVDDIKCKKLHLQEMIGQGAHGVVYKGSWNKQEVAIKVIMFEGDKEIKRKNSAIVEAAISSSLSHPQVLQSYAYSIERMRGEGIAHDLTGAVEVTGMTTEGSSMTVTGAAEIGVYKLYLVQEFCDLGNLTDFLRQAKFVDHQTGDLNFIKVCTVLCQISQGMRHLHLNNIVHGDLKTNNILMRTFDNHIGMTAKVSDFGLSVRLQESQSFISGRFAGTPFYVAPEVVQHGRLSKRADVFSFGVVMWELYNQEMIYQLASQQTGQNLSKSAFEPHLTTNQTFPTFPVSCPLPYALLCALCLSPNYHDRPDFNMVTQILDSLKDEAQNENIKPGEHNKFVNENFIGDDTPITIEQVLGYIQQLCTYNQQNTKKSSKPNNDVVIQKGRVSDGNESAGNPLSPHDGLQLYSDTIDEPILQNYDMNESHLKHRQRGGVGDQKGTRLTSEKLQQQNSQQSRAAGMTNNPQEYLKQQQQQQQQQQLSSPMQQQQQQQQAQNLQQVTGGLMGNRRNSSKGEKSGKDHVLIEEKGINKDPSGVKRSSSQSSQSKRRGELEQQQTGKSNSFSGKEERRLQSSPPQEVAQPYIGIGNSKDPSSSPQINKLQQKRLLQNQQIQQYLKMKELQQRQAQIPGQRSSAQYNSNEDDVEAADGSTIYKLPSNDFFSAKNQNLGRKSQLGLEQMEHEELPEGKQHVRKKSQEDEGEMKYDKWQGTRIGDEEEGNSIKQDVGQLHQQMLMQQLASQYTKASRIQEDLAKQIQQNKNQKASRQDLQLMSETMQQLDKIQKQIQYLQNLNLDKENIRESSQQQNKQTIKNITPSQKNSILPLQGDLDIDYKTTYNISDSPNPQIPYLAPKVGQSSPPSQKNDSRSLDIAQKKLLQQGRAKQYFPSSKENQTSNNNNNNINCNNNNNNNNQQLPQAEGRDMSFGGESKIKTVGTQNAGNSSNNNSNSNGNGNGTISSRNGSSAGRLNKVAYQIPSSNRVINNTNNYQIANLNPPQINNRYSVSRMSLNSSQDTKEEMQWLELNKAGINGNMGAQDRGGQPKNTSTEWLDLPTMGESIKNQPLSLVNVQGGPCSKNSSQQFKKGYNMDSQGIFSSTSNKPNPNIIPPPKFTNINSSDVNKSKLDMQVCQNESLMNFYWTNWSLFSTEDNNPASNDQSAAQVSQMHDNYKMKKLVQQQNGQYNAIPRSTSSTNYQQQQLQFREKY